MWAIDSVDMPGVLTSVKRELEFCTANLAVSISHSFMTNLSL